MSNCSLHARGTFFFSLVKYPPWCPSVFLLAFPFFVNLSLGAFLLPMPSWFMTSWFMTSWFRLPPCVSQWWPLHQSVRGPTHSRPETVHSSSSGPDIETLRHWVIETLSHWDSCLYEMILFHFNLIRVDPQSVMGNGDADEIYHCHIYTFLPRRLGISVVLELQKSNE